MIKHDINTIFFTDIKNIPSLTPSQNILHFIKKINLYDQL